jgi:hypothetical protein
MPPATVRTQVSSSSIAAFGYSADSTLDVEFRRGVVYRYFAVPRDVYNALISAESIGAYFNRSVRPHFRFERLPQGDLMQT